MRGISKHQTIISSRLLAQRQARSGMGDCLTRTCQSSNGLAEHMFAKGLLEDLVEPMRQGPLGEIRRWESCDEHRGAGATTLSETAEHVDPVGFVQPVIRDKAAGIAGGRIGKERSTGRIGPDIEASGSKQKL